MAQLEHFGFDASVVAEIANLIVLVQQQAWEEGHYAGGKACLDRFEQKFKSLYTRQLTAEETQGDIVQIDIDLDDPRWQRVVK